MNLFNRDHSRRQGITSVEFALLLPFLLALVMGIIEGGSMCFSWLTIQKAAQTGARFASTGVGEDEGTRLSQIEAITQDWLTQLDNGSKEILIKSWPDTAATGDGIDNSAGGPCQLVEVSVTYNYHPFTPLVGSLMPSTIDLYGYDRKVNEPWKPCD